MRANPDVVPVQLTHTEVMACMVFIHQTKELVSLYILTNQHCDALKPQTMSFRCCNCQDSQIDKQWITGPQGR